MNGKRAASAAGGARLPSTTRLRMFHAGMSPQVRVVFAVPRAVAWCRPARLPLSFGGLMRMRRARLIRIFTRLACTLGWLDWVGVVPLVGWALSVGLLLDHDLDPNALLAGSCAGSPDDESTTTQQG
jgi:hypothetical protein